MQYETSLLDIVYEAVFSTPIFKLARENVDVLSIFYQHLAPGYLVRPSDMQVSGGTALSDVKAKITLFRGNGVLELAADKLSATFTNANAVGDIETIKDCVTISLSALAEWLPTMTYREHVIRSAAYLSLLSDSQTAADDFLNNLMGNKMAFRGEDFGASKSHFGVKAEFENPEEKWIVSFDVSRSWIIGDMLIVNSSAIYQGDSAMKTLEDKAAHIQTVFNSFLTTLGLEAKK
ncbi:MAG: hypothetical protein L0Z68_10785 [Gammaproteobacteria bacterium]|nr:hypothetical protein [Gammaproteobacteria bacterium]